MWEHPATQRNLRILAQDGVQIVPPDAGEMACKNFGPGRLSEPDVIVEAALKLLRPSIPQSQDLKQEHLLVTAGATREEIDPVRFISNRSSGKMGFALAEAARKRGAQVTVIAGSTSIDPPAGIKLIRVGSADEMHRAVKDEIGSASVFVGAAAVSDYRPAKRAPEKIKKSEQSLILTLERTTDILQDISTTRKDGLIVIGFAAETENVLENARQKLQSKSLDVVVANNVGRNDAGFDVDTNAITIIRRGSKTPLELPVLSKLEAANRILDEIVLLRKDPMPLSAKQKN
jgi:phosphopantothenoylcysteine decarboxylase/phosphopantothenate--cysteine ligase